MTNSKEHVKAIILTSGWTYDQSINTEQDEEAAENVESEKKEAEDEVKETDRNATHQQAEKTKENKRASKPKQSRDWRLKSSAIVQKKLPPKELGFGEVKPTTISLKLVTEETSAIVQKKLPPKELGLGEVKLTTISLQLVDKSIKYPRGLIKDILVKVDKFIFPIDFIVLNVEKDEEIPLIQDQPFLATGKTLIDVEKGKLILRVGEEQVTYDVFKSMEFPSD
ncbi:hypothetical protein F2P56_024429, partial [Juglans regia]